MNIPTLAVAILAIPPVAYAAAHVGQPAHGAQPVRVVQTPAGASTPDPAAIQNRLKRAVQDGFSGAALIVEDGKPVLREGYGLASREEGTQNTPTTIFGIGSTPIDFTKAAILLLAQDGKLKLSDSIASYFPNVPKDKQGITLEHLMTGASGLKNFHHTPEDANPDHTWIDRGEAVSRILSSELLFEPGTSNEHSHSAFGLLAAIVEVASGQSYGDFLRTRFFEPLGMRDTGFFGTPIDSKRLAVGYGVKSGTGVNAPPFWGKTSWLVMGSGGMTSTLDDLSTFIQAMSTGKIVDRKASAKYLYRPGDMLAGGDVHGYEILISIGRTPGSLALLVNNSYNGRGPNPGFMQLFQDITGRAGMGGGPPPYTIGVRFAVDGEGSVRVDGVNPGSPAEAAGLEADDILHSINGKALGDEPLGVLSPLLQSDAPITFEVERKGVSKTIKVTPRKR